MRRSGPPDAAADRTRMPPSRRSPQSAGQRSVQTTEGVLALTGVVSACAPPTSDPATGFQVGQAAPPITGTDQYGSTRGLADYRGSWALIDLCPWWCGPCRSVAHNHAEFRAYVRNAGIPFDILAVVLERSNFDASVQVDAERWSSWFELGSSIVLHCDGDASSPLRTLSGEFASANGNTEPSYPTNVLVDPSGTIRFYRADNDLNTLQAALAALTGKTLSRTWTPQAPTSPPGGLVLGTYQVTGKLLDGPTFDETGPLDPLGSLPDGALAGIFDGSGSGVPGLDMFVSTISPDPASPVDLDLDTPVTVTCRPETPTPGTTYSRIGLSSDHVGFIDDAAYSESGVDASHLISTTGSLNTITDGVTLTAPSITTALAGSPVDGRGWSSVWIATDRGQTRPAIPRTLAETLLVDIAAEAALDPSQAAVATTQLQGVLSSLAARQFGAAASAGHAAAAAVAALPPLSGLRLDAEWLAGHLDSIAALG